jgi:hypothetical protein
MQRFLIASALVAALAAPAWAADKPDHFVVRDFEGYCAVLDAQPSHASNLKILGKQQGYDSHDAAEQALKSEHGCSTS